LRSCFVGNGFTSNAFVYTKRKTAQIMYNCAVLLGATPKTPKHATRCGQHHENITAKTANRRRRSVKPGGGQGMRGATPQNVFVVHKNDAC